MVNYVYLMLLVLLVAVVLELAYNAMAFVSLWHILGETQGHCSCKNSGVLREAPSLGKCGIYDTCSPVGDRSITIAEIVSIARTYAMIFVYLLLFVAVILESQLLFLIFMIVYSVMVFIYLLKILAYNPLTFSKPSLDAWLFPGTGDDTDIFMYFKLGGLFAEIFVFVAVFFLHRHLRKSRNLLFTLNLQSQIGSGIRSNVSDSRIKSDIGSRADTDAFGFLPKSKMESSTGSKLDIKPGKKTKAKGFLKKNFA